MNKQNQMVENVADNFGTIQYNIGILSKSVEDINTKIENLVDSNNVIINNIHQLSVSSEEMSNSAKDVESHSSTNQEEAEKAKQILLEVNSLVDEFEKYKA